MANDNNEVLCGVCHASNTASAVRCVSCGARLLQMTIDMTEAERVAHRFQQQGFSWRWVIWSAAVMSLSAFVVLCLGAMLIPVYDPQGFAGILIVSALWFVCGAGVGYSSPVNTFVEPPVGGAIAVVPTMIYLALTADVFELSTIAYVVGGLMAIMTAMVGALVGHYLREERNFRVWAQRFGSRSNPPVSR